MSMVGCFLLVYPGGQPGGWADVDPASDSFSYFSGAFDELKALIPRGAARELGMLAWLT